MENRISKEEMIMQMAETLSKRSTCQRLKVGAIIVDSKIEKVFAFGYNGNYRGGKNECDSKIPGSCGCLHAEINSLIKSDFCSNRIMFITDSPCIICSKSIINSGIETVYYRNQYRLFEGIELLNNAGIKVIKI